MWPSGILGFMLSSRLGNAAVLGVALARCEVGGSVGSWAAAEQICPQPAGQGIIAICPAQHIVAVPSAQCIADGPYAGMNISGVTGISPAQKAALKALGAVEIAP